MAEEDAVAEAAAELRAAEAEALAVSNLVEAGDESVSPEDLPKARSLVEYWRARTAGARQRLELAKVQRRDDAIDALKAEILADAPADGAGILTLARKAETALQALWDAAEARDAKMQGWWARAVQELGIPTDSGERGLNPRSYRGIDLSDDDGTVRLDEVKVGRLLSNLFVGLQGGSSLQPAITAPPESQSVRLATLESLRHIGKAD